MKPVVIMQSDPLVPPGTIVDYFLERKIAYKLIKTYTDEAWGELDGFRAMIILGSSQSAIFYSQCEHLVKLFEYVRKAVSRQFPILGICFGSQLLAMTLGAEVTCGRDMELGHRQVKLTDTGKKDQIFQGCDDELTVFQWHRDRWKLPPNARLLASNRESGLSLRESGGTAISSRGEP